eukprot:2166218-Prymnesium_polylepis.1
MQFDVPNPHNSYLEFPIQAAVRLVPPLPAGCRYLRRYVCDMCAACVSTGYEDVALVCATGGTGRGTQTGHACGDANDTTEPHTIATRSRMRVTA